ncbi:hypothetical protein CHY08_28615 (plasmid) [Rhizobium leguminosarum bv. viciae]|nr:hypothetical protein CHY08_28615 [Rhizobium leguminosarum bv. viciae]
MSDRAEASACDHRLDDDLIISLEFPDPSPNSFRALEEPYLSRSRTDKHVDIKLVVQLCNQLDTAAAEPAGQDRLPRQRRPVATMKRKEN